MGVSPDNRAPHDAGPLLVESLEERHLLAGVTLWAHGFNSSVDGWIQAQVDALAAREDLQLDQPWYRLEVTDPGRDGGPLSVEVVANGGPELTASETRNLEIALLLDWSDVAGTAVPGGGYYRSTTDVAAAVARRLSETDLLPDWEAPVATLPLHLIGHSRGGSLVGELARTPDRPLYIVGDMDLDLPPSRCLRVLL